jgi:hypothetical protein
LRVSADGAGDLSRTDDRWEQGSDFHLSLEAGEASYPWTSVPHSLWGSGRDALRALLAWGAEAHGWRRLLVPSYFCQPVVVAIQREIEVSVYEHGPTSPARARIEPGPGDVVLVVALFGMSPAPLASGGAALIVDFSHDPIGPDAARSTADYAIASLRKTLPLPDGGVLWSPRGLSLPAERSVTPDHASAVLDRLSAMTLKQHYLTGQAVDRAEIRRLSMRGEDAIGQGDISGISAFSRSRLLTLPVASWRAARALNLAAFREAVGELPDVQLMDAPFAATLIFTEPDARDRVRDALIAARIYPAVLWSLDEPAVGGIPAADVDLAHRILSIHCDYRYTQSDMVRVAEVIRTVAGTR